MDIALTLRSLFAISATTLGTFLSLMFFLHSHRNRTADFLLGGVFACIAVSQAGFLAYPGLMLDAVPHLSRTGYPALALMPALLFCYVRSLTEPGYRFGLRDLPHAAGFLAVLGVLVPYYAKPARFKIEHAFLDDLGPYYAAINTWVWYGVLVIVMGYLVACLVLVRRYGKRIREVFSNIESIRLSWLTFSLLFTTGAWVLVVFVSVSDLLGLPKALWKETVPGLVTIFLFFIGFRALTQPEIYRETGAEDGRDAGARPGRTAPLTEEKVQRYERIVRDSMERMRPYTDPDISLPALARLLSIPRNELSYVINTRMGGNFYDFINSYRVEEVKSLMLRPDKDNLTLLAIAQEAGFNSKATFNAIFKAHTATTPSQFKRAARAGNARGSG